MNNILTQNERGAMVLGLLIGTIGAVGYYFGTGAAFATFALFCFSSLIVDQRRLKAKKEPPK